MNAQVEMTLEEAVAEVLGFATGLDLTYDPTHDKFRAVTRQLNRALRLNALEHEWSFYSSVEEVGRVHQGDTRIYIRDNVRPRIMNDDAVRLVNDDGYPIVFGYFLPRDALAKYRGRPEEFRVTHTRDTIDFSRPIGLHEDGLRFLVPVMREPKMFRLPDNPRKPGDIQGGAPTPVPQAVLDQLVDFSHPDLITARAAYLYAQSDAVMQPRVPALEEQFNDLKYNLVERDERNTDSPYINEYVMPISNDQYGQSWHHHGHPHSQDAW